MSQALIRQSVLELTAPDSGGGDQTIDIEDLRDLMSSVTETTERLQRTHVALKNEVARLQQELADANAQLRRSRSLAALGEMAAGIAHEVRNPLGSIQLYVQILAEDLTDRPEQADLCRKIDRAVTGLDAIVRDVLSFARNMRVKCVATSAVELFDRAISNCQVLITGGDIRITREIDPELVVEVDTCLVAQALGNIIRNAVEAVAQHADEGESSGASGRNEIHLTADRRVVRCPNGQQCERLVLAVEDSGPGIPADVLERMFNPFFTTRRTGTGLGLAIVHRIVDAHGGHIHVRNVEGDGRQTGARIELYLPLVAEATAGSQQQQEEHP